MQFEDEHWNIPQGENPTLGAWYVMTKSVKCTSGRKPKEMRGLMIEAFRRQAENRRVVVSNGMRPKTLQMILGYSNIGITMNLYVRMIDDEKAKEVQNIEKMFKII